VKGVEHLFAQLSEYWVQHELVGVS
jgi:hypothetical protein